MLGKTNAVSGKQKYGAYNIEEVEVDGGVVLEITDADEKPVDKLQLLADTGRMTYAFAGIQSGKTVNALLAGVDTSKVTNMDYLFYQTNSSDIDFTNLDLIKTDNVSYMNHMFNSSSFKTIDLSQWVVGRPQMVYMFTSARATTIIMPKCTPMDMRNIFYSCGSLKYVDVSGVNTSRIKQLTNIFSMCDVIETIDLNGWDTSNVTSMESMFYGCKQLTTLNLTGFNTSNVYSLNMMFYNCMRLSTIQGTLDLYSATNLASMFSYTYDLTGVTLKNIRISLQIGSGTTYGHLWELPYLVNAVKELWDLTGSTQQTLTIGSANLEKIANVYVKLVDVTDEMTAQDPYAANKLPCVECESTDEGAMTLTAYAGLKNWVLA